MSKLLLPGRCLSLVCLGLLGLSALASCSSSGGSQTRDAAADTSDVSPADGGAQVPDSAVGKELAWVLAGLNGTTPTEEDVSGRFSATFLNEVPPPQVIDVLTQLAAAQPWTLVGFDGSPTALSLMAVVTRGDGRYWRIFVALDGDKIGGLLLTGAGELDPALRSWNAIEQAAALLPGRMNLLAATVESDACTAIHAVKPDTSLAVGSTFKLWVLAALADDIRGGRHSWVDTIPIADAHKSLPSGTLQNDPVGSTHSLRFFAEQMISSSDNTAADHLLFFLGRNAVESIVGATGHHQPSENQPFLGTREMFTLKLMATAAEQQAYASGTVAEKRALIEQYDATYDPRNYLGPSWTKPRAIETLEWFATPNDLCNVMRALRDQGDQPATQPVRSILALNPGIIDTSKAFDYVGFKGGSEPGVLNLTWLLRRQADQKWLFLTMGLNDPANDVDADAAQYLAGAARALLATP